MFPYNGKSSKTNKIARSSKILVWTFLSTSQISTACPTTDLSSDPLFPAFGKLSNHCQKLNFFLRPIGILLPQTGQRRRGWRIVFLLVGIIRNNRCHEDGILVAIITRDTLNYRVIQLQWVYHTVLDFLDQMDPVKLVNFPMTFFGKSGI
jgi:hypothetical protein